MNGAATRLLASGRFRGALTEYFIYHYWRTLPTGDVRDYIWPELLRVVDVTAVAPQKRAALDCFKSQTTRFYPWQARPNLTPELLDKVSKEPELFLRYDPARPGAAVFSRAATWIRLAHRLEPWLKKAQRPAGRLGATRDEP